MSADYNFIVSKFATYMIGEGGYVNEINKGNKKALSLALSTALVLTGANVGTLKADVTAA